MLSVIISCPTETSQAAVDAGETGVKKGVKVISIVQRHNMFTKLCETRLPHGGSARKLADTRHTCHASDNFCQLLMTLAVH